MYERGHVYEFIPKPASLVSPKLRYQCYTNTPTAAVFHKPLNRHSDARSRALPRAQPKTNCDMEADFWGTCAVPNQTGTAFFWASRGTSCSATTVRNAVWRGTGASWRYTCTCTEPTFPVCKPKRVQRVCFLPVKYSSIQHQNFLGLPEICDAYRCPCGTCSLVENSCTDKIGCLPLHADHARAFLM